jgi:hypothetical protein
MEGDMMEGRVSPIAADVHEHMVCDAVRLFCPSISDVRKIWYEQEDRRLSWGNRKMNPWRI